MLVHVAFGLAVFVWFSSFVCVMFAAEVWLTVYAANCCCIGCDAVHVGGCGDGDWYGPSPSDAMNGRGVDATDKLEIDETVSNECVLGECRWR